MLAASQVVFAQAKISDNVVRIGVNTDLSGFLSDVTGEGAVNAVRMAVADFGGKVLEGSPQKMDRKVLQGLPRLSSKSRL